MISSGEKDVSAAQLAEVEGALGSRELALSAANHVEEIANQRDDIRPMQFNRLGKFTIQALDAMQVCGGKDFHLFIGNVPVMRMPDDQAANQRQIPRMAIIPKKIFDASASLLSISTMRSPARDRL